MQRRASHLPPCSWGRAAPSQPSPLALSIVSGIWEEARKDATCEGDMAVKECDQGVPGAPSLEKMPLVRRCCDLFSRK